MRQMIGRLIRRAPQAPETSPRAFRLSEAMPSAGNSKRTTGGNTPILSTELFEPLSARRALTYTLRALFICAGMLGFTLFPSIIHSTMPTRSAEGLTIIPWKSALDGMTSLSSPDFRKAVWGFEGIVATFTIPFAIASRHPRKRPDNTAIHYAWLKEVMNEARKDSIILATLTILCSTASALSALYWASVVLDGKIDHSNETVLAAALTILTAAISLLPRIIPASSSGTMSSYARTLANFSHLSLWLHHNASYGFTPTSSKHSHPPSRKPVIMRNILAGPTILGTSTLIIVNGNPKPTAILTIFAIMIGAFNVLATRTIINEIPNIIMRRTGTIFTIWLFFTILITVTLEIILTSALVVLDNIEHPPTWVDLAVLLAGWAPCLHWQTSLVFHSLGRAPRNRMLLAQKWTGRSALNDLTLVAVHRSGTRIVQDLLRYETMPPTLDIGSRDLAAIAALIVPEGAVVREPASPAGSHPPRRPWRKRELPPQHQLRNSWLIDPSALIADGKKVKGEDMRQFLMTKAVDFMNDDAPSGTRSRQKSCAQAAPPREPDGSVIS
ncbi:hypothetical protein [Actinomyces sp. zg328]|uniref:hypothetical protein n=1 Tax=Actinomyces sp. zg328 TaxID=2609287 RepID=UPI00135804A9|nr:hypothetical protein [Actinomyces sp. zg328]